MARQNAGNVRTRLDQETFDLLVSEAKRQERTVSDIQRRAIRAYCRGGAPDELHPLERDLILALREITIDDPALVSALNSLVAQILADPAANVQARAVILGLANSPFFRCAEQSPQRPTLVPPPSGT